MTTPLPASSPRTDGERPVRVIKKLDQTVIEKIKAGEVVQRPCSAVKELLENSLDSGAKKISIQLQDGGLKLIQIQDDGHGISPEDLPLVCERHTTSKLENFEDLKKITTFGFRGEALASISHVSHVTITTKIATQPCGYKARYRDSKLEGEPKRLGFSGISGTLVTVEDLFYTMPSRKRTFLDRVSEEHRQCVEVVRSYAVKNPQVKITCKKAQEPLVELQTAGDGSVEATVGALYGSDVASHLQVVQQRSAEWAFTLDAYLTSPGWRAPKKTFLLFINNRLVDCKGVKKVIKEVYALCGDAAPQPFVYLHLQLNPANVDVNIHPTKREVRFLHEDQILQKVVLLLSRALKPPPPPAPVSDSAVAGDDMETSEEPQQRAALRQTTLTGEPLARGPAAAVDTLPGTPFQVVGGPVAVAVTALPPRAPMRPLPARPSGDGEHETARGEPPPAASTGSRKRTALEVFGPADRGLQPRKRQQRAGPKEQLTSIHNLLTAVRQQGHGELVGLMREHRFLGTVPPESAWSVVQHRAALYLVNHAMLSREVCYQFVLARFSTFAAIRLSTPLPVYELLLAGLDSDASGWQPDDGPKEELAHYIVRLLAARREMLLEYFALELAGPPDSPCLAALPEIVEGLVPDPADLPMFFLRLGTEVDWENEQPCLQGIAMELAALYSLKKSHVPLWATAAPPPATAAPVWFRAEGKDDHPLQRALQYLRFRDPLQPGLHLFARESDRGGRSYVVQSPRQFFQEFAGLSPLDRYGYEDVVREDTPLKLFVDLEFSLTGQAGERNRDKAGRVGEMVATFQRYAAEQWVADTQRSSLDVLSQCWVELDASEEAVKVSRHLFNSAMVFDDIDHCWTFMRRLEKRIWDDCKAVRNPNTPATVPTGIDPRCLIVYREKHGTVKQELFFDMLVYTRNRCFRLPYSGKSTDRKRMFLPVAPAGDRETPQWELFFSALCNCVDPECIPWRYPAHLVEPRKSPAKKGATQPSTPTRGFASFSDFVQSVLFEAVRDEDFIPPKRAANDGTVIRISTEEQLLPLLERCGPPPLFDYVLVVALNKEGDRLKPSVTYQFPPATTSRDSFVDSITRFCFPDLDDIPNEPTEQSDTEKKTGETFSFVLTTGDGARRFGYCRRLLVLSSQYPQCYCLVSFIPCFSLFSQLLDVVETRSKISSSAVFSFLKAVLANPLPAPGTSFTVRAFAPNSPTLEETTFVRPADDDNMLDYVSFDELLGALSPKQILKVFSALLFERRVIFIASKLSTLSSSVHAMMSLLYPFSWQHVFIPVLPKSMLSFCCAPMPFVVGILQSSLPALAEMQSFMEEVVMVNLSDSSVKVVGETPVPLGMQCLPKIAGTQLYPALSKMVKSKRKGAVFSSQEFAEPFLLFFVQLMHRYPDFLEPRLNKEKFLEVIPSENRRFMEQFMHSQMFEMFIREREGLTVEFKGNFDKRLYIARMSSEEEPLKSRWSFKKKKKEQHQQEGIGEPVLLSHSAIDVTSLMAGARIPTLNEVMKPAALPLGETFVQLRPDQRASIFVPNSIEVFDEESIPEHLALVEKTLGRKSVRRTVGRANASAGTLASIMSEPNLAMLASSEPSGSRQPPTPANLSTPPKRAYVRPALASTKSAAQPGSPKESSLPAGAAKSNGNTSSTTALNGTKEVSQPPPANTTHDSALAEESAAVRSQQPVTAPPKPTPSSTASRALPTPPSRTMVRPAIVIRLNQNVK